MQRKPNRFIAVMQAAMKEPAFRCYFLDFNERVSAVETFDAASDGHAVRTAIVMLYADPRHGSVELWSRGTCIFRCKRRFN